MLFKYILYETSKTIQKMFSKSLERVRCKFFTSRHFNIIAHKNTHFLRSFEFYAFLNDVYKQIFYIPPKTKNKSRRTSGGLPKRRPSTFHKCSYIISEHALLELYFNLCIAYSLGCGEAASGDGTGFRSGRLIITAVPILLTTIPDSPSRSKHCVYLEQIQTRA